MKKQSLTLKGVKAAARKFYKARRLTAQHKDREKRECAYKIGAYRCAIGASLTAATLKRMKDEESDHGYVNGICTAMNEHFTIKKSVHNRVRAIQKAHDDWCGLAASKWMGLDASSQKQLKVELKKARGLFLELIEA